MRLLVMRACASELYWARKLKYYTLLEMSKETLLISRAAVIIRKIMFFIPNSKFSLLLL